MLFDTEISIAIKNVDGQYSTKDFSVFEIEKICENLPSLVTKLNKGKEAYFKVKCPLCGEYHHYNFNVSDFIKRDMMIGGCETLGMPLFFIGNKQKVAERINKYREVSRKIYAMI